MLCWLRRNRRAPIGREDKENDFYTKPLLTNVLLPAVPPDLDPYQFILRGFEEVRQLHDGPMSSTYLVRNITTNVLYAAKVVPAAFDAQTELDILRDLNHPHIVSLLDNWSTSHSLILLTEFCAEGDLRAYISSHPRPPYTWVLRWFSQVCLAIHYCHKQRLIHLDLKLANVFLDHTKSVKLGDFGVSTYEGHAVGFRGTVGYICPELCKHIPPQQVSWAPDCWSLGCILYALLNEGREPFPVDQKLTGGRGSTAVSLIGATLEHMRRQVSASISKCLPEISQENQRKLKHLLLRKRVPRGWDEEETYFCLQLRQLLPALLQPDPEERPDLSDILTVLYAVEFNEIPDEASAGGLLAVHPSLKSLIPPILDRLKKSEKPLPRPVTR